MRDMAGPLRLGPLLRHVDDRSAAVWVEIGRAGTVTVRLEAHPTGRTDWRRRTFRVHDHHYALVEVDDLSPGWSTAYQVLVDDEVCWPAPDSSTGAMNRACQRSFSTLAIRRMPSA